MTIVNKEFICPNCKKLYRDFYKECPYCNEPEDMPHYTNHPSGVECIQITEHYNFNVGNAIKYLWRAGLKNDAIEDLKKAEFYIKREIKRLEND